MTSRDSLTIKNTPQTSYFKTPLSRRRELEANEAWRLQKGGLQSYASLLRRQTPDLYTSPLTLSHHKITQTCAALEEVYLYLSSQNYDPRTVEYYRRELLMCRDYVMSEVEKNCGAPLAQNAFLVDRRQKTGLIETPELRSCLQGLPNLSYQPPELFYNPTQTITTKLQELEARAKANQNKNKGKK